MCCNVMTSGFKLKTSSLLTKTVRHLCYEIVRVSTMADKRHRFRQSKADAQIIMHNLQIICECKILKMDKKCLHSQMI